MYISKSEIIVEAEKCNKKKFMYGKHKNRSHVNIGY